MRMQRGVSDHASSDTPLDSRDSVIHIVLRVCMKVASNGTLILQRRSESNGLRHSLPCLGI